MESTVYSREHHKLLVSLYTIECTSLKVKRADELNPYGTGASEQPTKLAKQDEERAVIKGRVDYYTVVRKRKH